MRSWWGRRWATPGTPSPFLTPPAGGSPPVGNTGNAFTLLNARSGAITAAGTTGNLVSGGDVLLTGNQGVGTSTNTIQTAAANLAAQAVSSGNVFVTENNGVSLRSLTRDLN